MSFPPVYSYQDSVELYSLWFTLGKQYLYWNCFSDFSPAPTESDVPLTFEFCDPQQITAHLGSFISLSIKWNTVPMTSIPFRAGCHQMTAIIVMESLWCWRNSMGLASWTQLYHWTRQEVWLWASYSASQGFSVSLCNTRSCSAVRIRWDDMHRRPNTGQTFRKCSTQGGNWCFWLSSWDSLLQGAGAHDLKLKEHLMHRLSCVTSDYFP